MMPSIIYEALAGNAALISAGITSDRIIESQSVDERPFATGLFITIRFGEMSVPTMSAVGKNTRACTVAVHKAWDDSRDYRPLTSILNKVDAVLLNLELATGTDNLRLTCVTRQGRSGNLVDEGWETISRTATYGVLYDEYAA